MGRPRGLFVGRFQPFHLGHLAVVRDLRRQHPDEELIVGVGSAQLSYTPENPFTAGERLEMIVRAAAEEHLEGLLPVPLLDIDRHALWVAYLVSLLPEFRTVYTSNPLTRELFVKQGFTVVEVPWHERATLEGRRIRRELAVQGAWVDRVAPSVRRYLEEIQAPARLALLQDAPRSPPVGDAP
ncbi:MAG TPA: nicotinamide-nucleotide adenylyltransferase [Thermoplasmata archaeon]|nr:nicotinamide-nucleotide adenylyltransferase [Thermoplasmata archaeon]